MDYAAARALKMRVLRHAFERFHAREWKRGRRAPRSSLQWIERERAWAEDLALYVALRDSHGMWGWERWPNEERERVPYVIDRARETLAMPILEHHYLQWIAHCAVVAVHAKRCSALGVRAHGRPAVHRVQQRAPTSGRAPRQFRRDVSLGAPPDAFSPDGQDWGLPAYDWARWKKTT